VSAAYVPRMDISTSGSSSIGVQQILPRSGTAWQSQNPTPVQPDSSASEEAAPPPDRGPTAEGVGQVVDKLV
jgi:hypothetical protein